MSLSWFDWCARVTKLYGWLRIRKENVWINTFDIFLIDYVMFYGYRSSKFFLLYQLLHLIAYMLHWDLLLSLDGLLVAEIHAEKGGKAFSVMVRSFKKCMLCFYLFPLTLHIELLNDTSHIDLFMDLIIVLNCCYSRSCGYAANLYIAVKCSQLRLLWPHLWLWYCCTYL